VLAVTAAVAGPGVDMEVGEGRLTDEEVELDELREAEAEGVDAEEVEGVSTAAADGVDAVSEEDEENEEDEEEEDEAVDSGTFFCSPVSRCRFNACRSSSER
jgi:hypothetical protein